MYYVYKHSSCRVTFDDCGPSMLGVIIHVIAVDDWLATMIIKQHLRTQIFDNFSGLPSILYVSKPYQYKLVIYVINMTSCIANRTIPEIKCCKDYVDCNLDF